MKWLKHMTGSRHDPKLRTIIRKMGPKAFGVYWICNEIIAENLDNNLECLIEHSLDELSDETCMKEDELKKVLAVLVERGLLKIINGKYQNPKVINYADEWTWKKIKSLPKSEIDRLKRDFGVVIGTLRRDSGDAKESLQITPHEVREGSEWK